MYKTAPNQPVNPRSFRVLLLGVLLALTVAVPFLAADDVVRTGETFPRQVLIVRHAEKPPETDNSVHLSKRGEQRAEALYKLFQPSSKRATPFPRPDFILATHNSRKSHRPLETVTPLSQKLELPINSHYRNRLEDDEREEDSKVKVMADLSKELFGNEKYEGKTILISWHHGTIPELAKQLRAKGYPMVWDGKVFDRVWQISYDKMGRTSFASLPQRLLSGDAKK